MGGRSFSEITCTDNEPPATVGARVLSGRRLAPAPWTAPPTKPGRGRLGLCLREGGSGCTEEAPVPGGRIRL